ncbi:MAG TPA: thiolase family protein [Acidimicrobiales bacterium]|jgi:acetyl-CoA acetyltransferase|nr:thiolase family protein [Acidimicrobiales bacterium]
MRSPEQQAVISGIGTSAVGRRLGRAGLDLTIDACLEAIADAGLTRDDIDGLATYPGFRPDPPGMSPVGVSDVKEALALPLNWYAGAGEGPGQLIGLFSAIGAVAAGLARHVLLFRTVTESSAQTAGRRASVNGTDGERVQARFEWSVPYKAMSAATLVGLMAQRHMHEFGTTREQLGAIALNGRRNAQRNPAAVYRDPLTMDDYLASRMISTPLCLYDCDVPVDGSAAFIVSHVDTLPELAHPPVRVEAIGTSLLGRDSWDQRADLTTMGAFDAASMLWSRTDLRPADVDVAELYDGFTYLALQWIEALGFCGHGEGGPFVEGGKRIAFDGEIPLNTHGGQLSAGRLHGYGFLHEACTQLWDRGGEHQVPGTPEVAVVGTGGGPLGGCVLLTRSR